MRNIYSSLGFLATKQQNLIFATVGGSSPLASHAQYVIRIILIMPTELPSAQQFTEEVEEAMSLDQQVSIQGQELADAENEARLTAAKIHFMDIFE